MHTCEYQPGDKVLLQKDGILCKSESRSENVSWTIMSVHTNGPIRVQCRTKSEWLNIGELHHTLRSEILVSCWCRCMSKDHHSLVYYQISKHTPSLHTQTYDYSNAHHIFYSQRLPFFSGGFIFFHTHWHLIAPFVGVSDVSQGCSMGPSASAGPMNGTTGTCPPPFVQYRRSIQNNWW